MKNLFLMDFKGLWKGLRFLYLAMGMCLALVLINNIFDHEILKVITNLIEIIFIYGIGIAMPIYYGMHYYRTLIGRQAEFYHMLPVSKGKLIWSKILAYCSHSVLLYSIIFILVFLTSLISEFVKKQHNEPAINVFLPGESHQSNIPNDWALHLSKVTAGQWAILGGLLFLIFILTWIRTAFLVHLTLQVQADSRFQKMGVGGSVLTCIACYLFELLSTILIIIAILKFGVYGLITANLSSNIYSTILFGMLFVIALILIQVGIYYWLNVNSMKKHLSI